MSALQQMLLGSAGEAAAAAIAFAGSVTTADADTTTHTFVGAAIGTAAANRYVLVGVNTRNSGGSAQTLSSLTVGGQATTEVASSLAVDGSRTTRFFITNAPVTSGSIADIAINHTGFSTLAIGVWALTNLVSNTAEDAGNAVGGEPLTTNVDVSKDGVVAAMFQCAVASSGAVTWTNITERFEDSYDSTRKSSGASDAFNSAQNVSTTVNVASVSSGISTLSMVAFR